MAEWGALARRECETVFIPALWPYWTGPATDRRYLHDIACHRLFFRIFSFFFSYRFVSFLEDWPSSSAGRVRTLDIDAVSEDRRNGAAAAHSDGPWGPPSLILNAAVHVNWGRIYAGPRGHLENLPQGGQRPKTFPPRICRGRFLLFWFTGHTYRR